MNLKFGIDAQYSPFYAYNFASILMNYFTTM